MVWIIVLTVVYTVIGLALSELAASLRPRFAYTVASAVWFLVTLAMIIVVGGWCILTVLAGLLTAGLNVMLALLADFGGGDGQRPAGYRAGTPVEAGLEDGGRGGEAQERAVSQGY